MSPVSAASASARSRSLSATQVRRTPAIPTYFRACNVPSRPAPTIAARRSGMPVQRDAEVVAPHEGDVAFENQRLARLDPDHGRADLAQQIEGRGPDCRTVKAEVLPMLR